MRVLKKLSAALALGLTLTLIAPIATPATPVAVAEAATIKLNKTKKTLKVGQTYQLKVSGTKKTVKWKSSKKSVASVSSKGKVKAKKVGKTNITATVAGKTLKCKITVKAADNPALAKAPFDAKEVTTNGYSFVVPKDWISISTAQEDSYTYSTEFKPSEEHLAAVAVMIQEADDQEIVDYATMKELLSLQFSKENMEALAVESFGDATLSAYKISDVETSLGTAFKLSYEITANIETLEIPIGGVVYAFWLDDCMILIQAMELSLEGVKEPTPLEAAEYIVQSLIKK